MKVRAARTVVGLLLACGIASACATVPYTGRPQLLLMSIDEERSLGEKAFRQHMGKVIEETDPEVLALVRDVGERIARVAERPDYKWDFRVIRNAELANAFALPGGKVAVYTGLFRVAQDTAGLAAVMGHEVGHAIARHGAERLSSGVVLDILGAGVAAAVGGSSKATQAAVQAAFGLGSQVGVLLPFSRAQEAEADYLGLILMAKAGYDPHAAVGLWERFASMGNQRSAEFLSTHPAPESRQKGLREALKDALPYFRAAPPAPVLPLPKAR